MAKKITTKITGLPGNITEADTKWPSWEQRKKLRKADRDKLDVVDSVTLYETESFGWVVCTLPISKGRLQRADRTYGITVGFKKTYSGDERQLVRVGNGPHVKRTVEVHVTKGRQKELQWLLDLREEGLGKAGMVRDRISTRRAQGAMRRSAFGGGLLGW